MITEQKYCSQMELILSSLQSNIKEMYQLTVDCKRENPDVNYERIFGSGTDLDKKMESLSFIAPNIEDILNGKAISHTSLHKETGYDKSRTRRVRMAYGYNQ